MDIGIHRSSFTRFVRRVIAAPVAGRLFTVRGKSTGSGMFSCHSAQYRIERASTFVH